MIEERQLEDNFKILKRGLIKIISVPPNSYAIVRSRIFGEHIKYKKNFFLLFPWLKYRIVDNRPRVVPKKEKFDTIDSETVESDVKYQYKTQVIEPYKAEYSSSDVMAELDGLITSAFKEIISHYRFNKLRSKTFKIPSPKEFSRELERKNCSTLEDYKTILDAEIRDIEKNRLEFESAEDQALDKDKIEDIKISYLTMKLRQDLNDFCKQSGVQAGDFKFESIQQSEKMQEAANAAFVAEQEAKAQQIRNEQEIRNAKAKAEADKIRMDALIEATGGDPRLLMAMTMGGNGNGFTPFINMSDLMGPTSNADKEAAKKK